MGSSLPGTHVPGYCWYPAISRVPNTTASQLFVMLCCWSWTVDEKCSLDSGLVHFIRPCLLDPLAGIATAEHSLSF